MKPFNKKVLWIFLAVLVLGTFLRLLGINKPEGLWNDEYVSWYVASIPFGKEFINQVFAQCHMPFYYLYLKFFMNFGQSDLALRLSSVFAGMLSIVVMYFVGREFKNKRLGIFCAIFTAISSFLIYYSQEVRMYEVLFLISAFSLLYTLKLVKNPKPHKIFLYFLSLFLILFTHTIGFVYVFFSLFFVSYMLINKNVKYKKTISSLWIFIILGFLVFSPLTFKIFTESSYSQWWGHFTFSKILFLISDYFSPVLTSLVNAPDNFFYNFSTKFFIFAILPSLLAIYGTYRAIRTGKTEALGLFLVVLGTLSVLSIAAAFGKMVFITKYSIEIYPILITIFCFGISEVNNRKWKYFLALSFCFIQLLYLFTMPDSAIKRVRTEGHKLAADLILGAELKKGDFVLLEYYPKERFERYFDFEGLNVISINKGNFSQYLTDKELVKDKIEIKKQAREIFSANESNYFDKKLKKEIFQKMKKGQKISVIFLNSVSMISPNNLKKIAFDDKAYEKTPFLFSVFSYLKNETIESMLTELKPVKLEQKGSWLCATFKK
ncbi:MAG TPA: glycosyltransferase family 39 protein [Candidatus Gastranaerophilaceae bacterium]|nr:glycosyltransferase family 39 protein [Candidatus Gastranaerophilaceae bacterium]